MCSSTRWVAHVEAVYRRHYLLSKAELMARTGGGISLPTVLAVAARTLLLPITAPGGRAGPCSANPKAPAGSPG